MSSGRCGKAGSAAFYHSCGTCALAGPLANVGANELRNRRCVGDTSGECTSDPDCGVAGGTCELFLGTLQPIYAGGVALCGTNQFAGPVSGTVDVETGALAAAIASIQRLYFPGLVLTDHPCPRCLGDGAANDGVVGGTCSDGAHDGDPCDANGTVPGRPDFDAPSLDCPPTAATLVAALPIQRNYTTDVVTRTRSADSPGCFGAPGSKCLCDTCNNANAEPCAANVDCPDPPGPTGPICGGRRCIGGGNVGTPCTNGSECPGGSCNRPGCRPSRARASSAIPRTRACRTPQSASIPARSAARASAPRVRRPGGAPSPPATGIATVAPTRTAAAPPGAVRTSIDCAS